MNFSIVSLICVTFILLTARSYRLQRNYNSARKNWLISNRINHLWSLPRQSGDREKYAIKRLLKTVAVATSGVLSAAILRSQKSQAVDVVLPECSDSISTLTNSNREIVIIGTSHISEESAKLVKRTIKSLTPDVVMIELDLKRLGNRNLTDLAETQNLKFEVPQQSIDATLQPKNSFSEKDKNNFLNNLFTSLLSTVKQWITNTSGMLVGKVLSQFYDSIEKLGFSTGAEMKAAIDEARSLENTRILLGDRDVDVTLQRLSAALAMSDPESFDRVLTRISEVEQTAGFPTMEGGEDFDKEKFSQFMEALKQREVLQRLSLALKEETPMIYNALIGERDAYMAESMFTANSTRLVGVVGMMHMSGIEQNLVQRYNFTLINRTICGSTANSKTEIVFNLPIIS